MRAERRAARRGPSLRAAGHDVNVPKTKDSTRPKKSKARSRPKTAQWSEWNGHDVDLPGASELCAIWNGQSLRLRHKSKLSDDVADVLDAIAWGLNRNDTTIIKRLAGVALPWVRAAFPLVAEKTRAATPKSLPIICRSNLDAYRLAVATVEKALRLRPGSRELPASNLAMATILSLTPPLPTMDITDRVQLAKWRKAGKRGLSPNWIDISKLQPLINYITDCRRMDKRLDALLLVDRALALAGVHRNDVKRLNNSWRRP